MITRQMELTLAAEMNGRRSLRPRKRMSRARWWFNQMRSVVDAAIDWEPRPQPRPEQAWLPVVNEPIGSR